MEVKFVICAERIVRDSESNRVSASFLFEDGQASAFPVVIPYFSAMAVLQREENELGPLQGRFRLSHNGAALLEMPFDQQYAGNPRSRHFARINGLSIPGPGEVEARFFVKTGGDDAEEATAAYSFRLDGPEVQAEVTTG